MQFPFFIVFVGWKTKDAIRVILQTIWLVQSQKLKWCTFVILQRLFWLSGVATRKLIETGHVFPNKALQVGRSICQFARALRQDLAGIGLMHVITYCLTSIWNVFLNEIVMSLIVDFELVVASFWVITESASDCQVFRPRVKHNSSRLALRRSNIDGTNVNSITSIFERYLKAQIVFNIKSRFIF